MTGIILHTTQLMVSRKKSCQHNSRATLRAKPSHVWMSPEAKATFDLSLRFDQAEGELALSNMPEIDVEKRKETGIWKFETTPRMSSYLLAFVAGDLQGVTAKTKNGTLVGVYSTKAHPLSNLDFSLDIAVRFYRVLRRLLRSQVSNPQSLHIALPDFSAGAMKLGLVTT